MNEPVVLGYVAGQFVEATANASLLNLVVTEARGSNRHITHALGGVIGILGNCRIAAARNQVVEAFLKGKAEYLWMVDTDILLKPDTLDQLLACQTDIVGALYFSRPSITGDAEPVMWMRQPHGTLKRWAVDIPADRLMPVDATGAGCILIHRDVLEDVQDRFAGRPLAFFQDVIENGQDQGEDITFCVRTKALGYQTYVHTGIQVGHIKPSIVDLVSWTG